MIRERTRSSDDDGLNLRNTSSFELRLTCLCQRGLAVSGEPPTKGLESSLYLYPTSVRLAFRLASRVDLELWE